MILLSLRGSKPMLHNLPQIDEGDLIRWNRANLHDSICTPVPDAWLQGSAGSAEQAGADPPRDRQGRFLQSAWTTAPLPTLGWFVRTLWGMFSPEKFVWSFKSAPEHRVFRFSLRASRF